MIEQLLRPQVKSLKAYHVEEPDVPVKLHANESPFNLSTEIKTAIFDELAGVNFNRYPDPDCADLRKLLAESVGVERDQIVLGNGSDEIIQMIIMAFGGHSFPVVFPSPTFSMYKNIALSLGEEVNPVSLTDSFELDVPSLIANVEKGSSITFISYPNNPTGNCFSKKGIEEIIRASKGIVVVDEAYFDYSKKTFINKLKSYPNLIILRTLSKTGFASLRLGFLIASKEMAGLINRVRLPYNITSFSKISALAALKFKDEMDSNINLVIKERDKLLSQLEDITALKLFRTDSNFILFRVDNSEDLFKRLKGRGILIRNLHSNGALNQCMRVTVGNEDENKQFLKAMKSLLK